MSIEIHRPELERRLREKVQSGRFDDMDELLMKALDALSEKERAEGQGTETKPTSSGRPRLVELFDPVRGLADDVDFGRNPSTGRPLEI